MRTVIKNRVYNTDTAQKIAVYEHGSVTETLYRKKTGEFSAYFYNADADNDNRAGWRGKEKIAPYDFETARAWAEMSLDEKCVRELFDGVLDDGATTVASVRISRATLAKMRKAQSETGETIGEIVDRLVTEGL
jgi:hypothetical protein